MREIRFSELSRIERSEWMRLLPNLVKLLGGLARDPRVSWRLKALLAGTAVYVVSPIDLIPTFIPILGQMDDLAVLLFALNATLNEVDEAIVLSHWEGDRTVLAALQALLERATPWVPDEARAWINPSQDPYVVDSEGRKRE